MEALACGTPVITFDTCGSPEIPDYTCGKVVKKENIEMLIREIICICETKCFSDGSCITRSREFDKSKMCEDYLNLYEEICKG